MKVKSNVAVIAALVFAVSYVSGANAANVNLIQNGSFESGYSGWTPSRDFSITSTYGATDGQSSLIFAYGDQPGSFITQNITTQPGVTYDVSFDWKPTHPVAQSADLTVNTNPVFTVSGTYPGPYNPSEQFTRYSTSFVANSTTTSIGFRDTSGSSTKADQAIDSVSVYAHRDPNASTFGLFLGVNDAKWPASMDGDGMAQELYTSFKRQGNRAEIMTADLRSNGSITYQQINQKLKTIKEEMKPGDEFVFYAHSHGGGGIGEAEYLKLGEPLFDFALYDLLYSFDPTGIYRKSVFIDACRAGGYWTLDPSEFSQDNLSKIKNISFYAAAPENEYSYFEFASGHGFYSQAIKSAIDNDLNQTYNASQLASYLSRETKDLIGIWHAQHPYFYEGAFGDQVLANPDLANPMWAVSGDFDQTRSLTSRSVPEPGSLGLVFTTLIALALQRRRAWKNGPASQLS